MIRHPEPSAAPTAQRSVSRAIVAFIAAIVALTGVFTLPPTPTRAATFTVSSTADSGAGSLRQALLDANAAPGPDAIDFAIAGTGPHTIALSSALPIAGEAITIDASAELISGAPGVVLDGTATVSVDGLVIANPLGFGTVTGLQIVNFDGAGIHVKDSDGAILRGNRIGTDGAADLGNGIGIAIENSFEVIVGGTDPVRGQRHRLERRRRRPDYGLRLRVGPGKQHPRQRRPRHRHRRRWSRRRIWLSAHHERQRRPASREPWTRSTTTSKSRSFANPACDASGFGEGASLLGTTTADAAGNWTIAVPATNGTHLSATATFVDISETTTSEFGACFEVVDGLPAAGTWVGERTSATGGVVPGGDAVLAAGSAADGPAQFTYGAADPLPDSGIGASGSWTFETTAAAAESIQIDWRYTGFHAFAGVTVGLEAFVTGSGDVITPQPLVAAGPQSCIPIPPDPGCPEPSGGFDYDGTVEFNVQPGDMYGFTLTGSNGDSNETLRGELVLGTALPTDCADAQALYADEDDGRYVILPSGGQRFSVHCADMDATAKDYLELHPAVTGPGFNFSSYAAGGAAPGTTVTTSFTKVRFDPATLLVDIDDRTFSTSTGGLSHPEVPAPLPVTSMPYATAMACNPGGTDGTANVNLFGTPFVVDDTWTPSGAGPTGSATFSAGNTVVDVTGNGYCGWNHPDAPGFLYPFEPNPDRFVLQLEYATDGPQLETPTLFASVAAARPDRRPLRASRRRAEHDARR